LYGFKGGVDELGTNCNAPDGEHCEGIWEARATSFSVLYFGLLLHAYNVRHPRMSVFQMKWFDNAFLWGSCVFGAVTLVPILYVEPIATNVFVHRRITWEWAVIAAALLIFMATSELYKLLKRRFLPSLELIHDASTSATESPFSGSGPATPYTPQPFTPQLQLLDIQHGASGATAEVAGYELAASFTARASRMQRPFS
jgi:hypothetical protein